MTFALSLGEAHRALEGRVLLCNLGPRPLGPALLMDRAYEGDAVRQLTLDLSYQPVVLPFRSRRGPWEYGRELYKRRNESDTAFVA